MEGKKAYLSKTFWLGLVTAIAPAMSVSVQALIQEHTVSFSLVWGAVAIVLRLVTKEKVVLLD